MENVIQTVAAHPAITMIAGMIFLIIILIPITIVCDFSAADLFMVCSIGGIVLTLCIELCVNQTKAEACSQITITPADNTKPIIYIGKDVDQSDDLISFIDINGEEQILSLNSFANSTFSIKEIERSACEDSGSADSKSLIKEPEKQEKEPQTIHIENSTINIDQVEIKAEP